MREKTNAHDTLPDLTVDLVLDTAARQALLDWYGREHRRLPWRAEPGGSAPTPYAVLVSELMLQQTRVDTVIEPYRRWMARWPTLHDLARADLQDVLAQWTGLGYYRRARHLHAAAVAALERHGELPNDPDLLRRLPGLGPYTVGAVRSIAFGEPEALVDGNVVRVLARWHAWTDAEPPTLSRTWKVARRLVSQPPASLDPSSWNQALMELGATVCTPRRPACLRCPVREPCRARQLGLAEAIPPTRVRAAVQEVQAVHALVWRAGPHGREVLLGRRPATGRWAGLWEPPGAEGPDARATVAAWLAQNNLRESGQIDAFVHVLTHRRYHVAAVVAATQAIAPDPVALGYVEARWLPLAEVASPTSGMSRLAVRLCEGWSPRDLAR
ncbi:MAG: A/G-specific adenine glycosylase [Myxococcota bacterium]